MSITIKSSVEILNKTIDNEIIYFKENTFPFDRINAKYNGNHPNSLYWKYWDYYQYRSNKTLLPAHYDRYEDPMLIDQV
jgi:hypothetical protein